MLIDLEVHGVDGRPDRDVLLPFAFTCFLIVCTASSLGNRDTARSRKCIREGRLSVFTWSSYLVHHEVVSRIGCYVL